MDEAAGWILALTLLANIAVAYASIRSASISKRQLELTQAAREDARREADRAVRAAEASAASTKEAASAAIRSAEAAERANRIEEARDGHAAGAWARAHVRAEVEAGPDSDTLRIMNAGPAEARQLMVSVDTPAGGGRLVWMETEPPRQGKTLAPGGVQTHKLFQYVAEGQLKQPLVVDLAWEDDSPSPGRWKSG